jgi:hypothetical protein
MAEEGTGQEVKEEEIKKYLEMKDEQKEEESTISDEASLSSLSDSEAQKYLLDEEEVDEKTSLWNSLNQDWLEEQLQKKKDRDFREKHGIKEEKQMKRQEKKKREMEQLEMLRRPTKILK